MNSPHDLFFTGHGAATTKTYPRKPKNTCAPADIGHNENRGREEKAIDTIPMRDLTGELTAIRFREKHHGISGYLQDAMWKSACDGGRLRFGRSDGPRRFLAAQSDVHPRRGADLYVALRRVPSARRNCADVAR